jgi:hypothetical protein
LTSYRPQASINGACDLSVYFQKTVKWHVTSVTDLCDIKCVLNKISSRYHLGWLLLFTILTQINFPSLTFGQHASKGNQTILDRLENPPQPTQNPTPSTQTKPITTLPRSL